MIELDDGFIFYRSRFSRIHDLIMPSYLSCGLCQGDSFTGTKLCAECRKITPENLQITCELCGRKVHTRGVCGECKLHPPRYSFGISPLSYVAGGKQLVQYFKMRNGNLKHFLADLIAAKTVGISPVDIVTAVPADRIDIIERGYNPSGILGKAVAKRIHRPYVESMKKMFSTQEQKALPYAERVKNLRGAFLVTKPEAIKGKRVLLVDDIVTTGATANEVTRVLMRAGAEYVILATAASPPDTEVTLSELNWFPMRSGKKCANLEVEYKRRPAKKQGGAVAKE